MAIVDAPIPPLLNVSRAFGFQPLEISKFLQVTKPNFVMRCIPTILLKLVAEV